MSITRRDFTGLLATIVGGSALPLGRRRGAAPVQSDPCALPGAVKSLSPMTEGVVAISATERQGRMERARQLHLPDRLGDRPEVAWGSA